MLGSKLDMLADAYGNDHHAALFNLVNVAGPIAPALTLVGELWTMTNFDPANHVTQVLADAVLAWFVSDRIQLDMGVNIGLTRSTSNVELYPGASVRFEDA